MISVHHISKTTYNQENPFGLKEPFGVTSTNIDLARAQIAALASEYIENGLGEGFTPHEGEILQHDCGDSLKATRTGRGISCEFTGNEVTFWLAKEGESTFDQGVHLEIASSPLSEDGFVHPDIPTLLRRDEAVLTELKYNVFSRCLHVTYHDRKSEKELKRSKFLASNNSRYIEEDGRTFHGHTDMNGSFCLDDEKAGRLEDCIPKGWQRKVFLDAKRQLDAFGMKIGTYSIHQIYDATKDYLAMGGDEVYE